MHRHWKLLVAALVVCLALWPFTARAADAQPTKVTLALVGAAHVHAPGFIAAVKARHDVRVKYVWDHDAALAKQCAAQLDAKVVSSPEQIWSDPEVAAVAIYSETDRHYDLVLAAAKAGKHMFVEKPLGADSRQAAEMAAAIERAGLLFNMGYMNRSLPAHLFLKEQIASGNLGKITRVRAATCHSAALDRWFAGSTLWMADLKQAGVGGFGDLGTHSLDLLMWMLGDVESVTGDIKIVAGNYGPTDDCGEALLRFKNGTTGVIAASWVDVANPVTLEIAGTEGHAVIFNGQLYFQSKHVPGADGHHPWKQLPPGLSNPVDMFLDAVCGKQHQPLVTPREAAARVSVMEAIYHAAKNREWVKPK